MQAHLQRLCHYLMESTRLQGAIRHAERRWRTPCSCVSCLHLSKVQAQHPCVVQSVTVSRYIKDSMLPGEQSPTSLC